MKKTQIDINADLGEGAGNDAQIMPLISSCNIACGGHFGTEETMRNTIKLALKYKVKIGAHPSFPDTDNFGRKIVTLTKTVLTETVFKQLTTFLKYCELENATLSHVKLHGALYNYAAKDAATSDAVIEAILKTRKRPILYVPPGSVLEEKAKNLLPIKREAFIDRKYNDDLSLVSRSSENAIIKEELQAFRQLVNMVLEKTVKTVSGASKTIEAKTFCIHSDTKNAASILRFIRKELVQHSIEVV